MIKSILFVVSFILATASISILAITSSKKAKRVSKKGKAITISVLSASILFALIVPGSFHQVEAEGDAAAQLVLAEAAAKAATAKIIELARTLGYEIEETTDSNGVTTYKIIIPVGQEEEFRKLVLEYLEYLAYLEKWNGDLPDVIASDDGISIIMPKSGD